MFTVGRALQPARLPRRQPVRAHQPGGPVTPDLMAVIDETAVHARAATSAVRRGEGCPDIGRVNRIPALTGAGRTAFPRKSAALANAHNPALRVTGSPAVSASMTATLTDFPPSPRRPRLHCRPSRA
jgi:hypothetical protein